MSQRQDPAENPDSLFAPDRYLDASHTAHPGLLEGAHYVWELINRIRLFFLEGFVPAIHGTVAQGSCLGQEVFVGKGTVIEPGVVIEGPAWIGEECHLRPGAYLRPYVIVEKGSVVGNSCELKNAWLFEEAEVPHFNYVGDSILGYRAHLGAGAILSNLKLTRDEVCVRHGSLLFRTGLRKFGAILGDRVEVGCNAVLNPGSIVGRDACIYPGVVWRGVLEEGAIVKWRPTLEVTCKKKRSSKTG
ncbi:acyltransferase [Candidatus Methylacidithermus pantelleriae]|uniref:Glucosamine-1-phosphate N-acetyltransferase n=1 Tax=Candidatus Methylacidithermus pantelleriae TaxID=2744239 RepID=A0A8J2BU20_9BACT|nr:UDP-N-acetylglucosamine diphosphorylase [Candidatus Methylacidithermus pantelleriae]CAF0699003.1 Glucosamine-1-phosphate N-acetyltransferase [Candidatus Methylacidithermus pantelleriae]